MDSYDICRRCYRRLTEADDRDLVNGALCEDCKEAGKPSHHSIVQENGGLHNTLSMGMYGVGYKAVTDGQKQVVDSRVNQLGVCPVCGEKPTYRTPDGVLWDPWAHSWIPGKKRQ